MSAAVVDERMSAFLVSSRGWPDTGRLPKEDRLLRQFGGAACTLFCTVDHMDTLPLSDARSTLSSIVERVEGTHERVTITRNGRPAAVLISPEDLGALEETLDVLSDPVAMQQLRASEAAIAAGDVLDEAALRDLVAKRTP